MTNLRRSIVLSSISRYTVNILSIVSIIVTARLLTPEELGIYSITSAFVLFVMEFRSLGAGTYLIRNKELKDSNIMKATGLMILISWGLGISILLVSDYTANFYQIEDISLLLKLLTFSFFLSPFISVPKSVLTRNFEFRKLLIIDITTQLTYVFITILLILYGYSYFSLAYATILSNIVELILVIYLKGSKIPLLPSFRGLSEIAKFGSLLSLTSVFKRLSLTSSDLVIGKMGTTTDVAVFSRGLGFFEFLANTIAQGVNPVILPFLSNEIREQRNIQDSYIKATALLGSVVWPTLIIAGIAAYPMIVFMFGNQWEASVPLAKILCFWAFFRSIHSISDHVLIVTKNEKHLLIREFVFFCFTLTGIVLFQPYGLEAIAWALAAISLLYFGYTSILLKALTGVHYLPFFKKIWPVFILTGILGLSTFLVDITLDFNSTSPLISLSILFPISFIIWIIGSSILNLDIYKELVKVYIYLKDICYKIKFS